MIFLWLYVTLICLLNVLVIENREELGAYEREDIVFFNIMIFLILLFLRMIGYSINACMHFRFYNLKPDYQSTSPNSKKDVKEMYEGGDDDKENDHMRSKQKMPDENNNNDDDISLGFSS